MLVVLLFLIVFAGVISIAQLGSVTKQKHNIRRAVSQVTIAKPEFPVSEAVQIVESGLEAIVEHKPVKPALRIPQEKTQTVQPVKPDIHDIDVAVFVLSRRSAFETREVIRQTWAFGHKNVFFAVGKCCSVPPDDRKKYTCVRSKSSSASSQTSWNAQCAAEDEKLANEQQHYSDMITMPEVDVYRHLPHKVKYCYKWGLKHTEAKWFVKTDDDSVVRIGTLGAYLEKTYDSTNPMVIGRISKGWGVPRSGKWAETDYKPSKYPNFPLGSVGHVVSKSVATYIADNSEKLFNYQGEDVSIGIWLNESPLKVKWVTSKRMTNHGNCKDTGMWVIGHNIKPAKMKACFAHKDETKENKYVGVNLVGGLGNNLFMLASTIGIARENNAIPCYIGINKASNLVKLDVKKCPQSYVKQSERGYAKYTPFKIKKSTMIGTYLQSYKYFKLTPFKIKQNMNSFGHDYVKKHSKKATNVGIHVRRGDHLKYDYLNFPDDQYFKNAMQYFTDKYGNVQFFVASNDIPWCKKQSFLKGTHLVLEKHTAAQDMAILANCDHVIMSIGTFGWWGGLLSGGEVVYSSEEFNMNHNINKGNVVKDDYYPKTWKEMSSLVIPTQSYSTIVTAYFELKKSKHSKSDYDSWMRNILLLKDAMIIFTSPLLVPKIKALRAHSKSKTKIISMQLEDSKMVSDYSMGFWKNQVSIDPEKYHSSELYIIWQEKSNFLKRAKDLNPFSSEFFAWFDIGYFRTKKYNNKVIIKKIPDDLRLDQVMFLDASSLVKGLSKEIIGDGKYLGGGFIGGFSKGIDLWNKAYYEYLHLKRSEFVGIDQPRYYQTCMLNIGLCKIVQPKSGYGDPWFFMKHYLNTANDALSSQCLQNLAMNMPVDKNGVMKAHHWDARTGKWNEEKRWLPMNLVAPCMIWYVGANTHGRDGVRLQKEYSCNIHVFEPVPSFANVLKKNWKNVPRSTVHAFGLGSESKQVEHVHVVGESTFAMSDGKDFSGETVHIKSIVEAWEELGKPSIDLLHINCEGCEWEMLETMISSGIVNKVRILQVGTHWFANVKNIQQRYCNIESKLSATHTKKFQQYFGWERWETRAPMHSPPAQSSQPTCNCSPRQRCFLGRCFCLPGYTGAKCTSRKIYHKVKAALCPNYITIDTVRSHSFLGIKSRCAVNSWANTPVSCEVFCNWQEDVGIASISASIWSRVSDNEHAHHVHYKVAKPNQIPEGQTRWAEYTAGFKKFKAFAENQSLGAYLEVGAGLYTQLFNILTYRPDIKPTSITLVEPNIHRYTSMPQCLYQNGQLKGQHVKLVDGTTETMNMPEYFDTVLVMNVIEHVLDAFDFLESTYNSLKPGGLFIFGERYFDDPDEPSTKVLGSATLHPIRLNKKFVDFFLSKFDTIYKAQLGQTPQAKKRGFGEKGYFFIGRKKDSVEKPNTENVRGLQQATAAQYSANDLFSNDFQPPGDSKCDISVPLSARNVLYDLPRNAQNLISPSKSIQCRHSRAAFERGILKVNAPVGNIEICTNTLDRCTAQLKGSGLVSGPYLEKWDTFQTPLNKEILTEFLRIRYPDGHEETFLEPIWEPRTPQTGNEGARAQPNVLLLVVDNLSRQDGMSYLPETMKFLKNQNKRGKSFVFNRAGSTGLSTAPSMTPILTGFAYDMNALDESRTQTRRYVPNVNTDELLTKVAREQGYKTYYGTDQSDALFLGCLWWDRSWFDHVIPTPTKRGVSKTKCAGNAVAHQHGFHYIRKLMEKSAEPFFTYYHLSHGHANPKDVNVLDVDIRNLVQFAQTRNTVIFLIGDHGSYSSFQSKMPLVTFNTPEGFEFETSIIKQNQRRLVAQYDIGESIRWILTGITRSHKFGLNLFSSIVPWSRSCEEAGIPSNRCFCSETEKVLALPGKILNYVNERLNKNAHDVAPSQCARLTIEHVNAIERSVLCQGQSRFEFNRKCDFETYPHQKVTWFFEIKTNKNQIFKIEIDSQRTGVDPNGGALPYPNERKTYLSSNNKITYPKLTFKQIFSGIRIRQLTRYGKFESCTPSKADAKFCVCSDSAQILLEFSDAPSYTTT